MNKWYSLNDDWALKAQRTPVPLSPSSPLFAQISTYRLADWQNLDGIQVHEGFEVGIVLDGKIVFEFKDTVKVLRKGDIWLCGPWEPHRDRLTLFDPVVIVMVFLPQLLGDEHLAGISWKELFAAKAQDRPWVTTPAMRRSIFTLAKDIRREIEQQPLAWETAVRFDMLRLLFLLSRDWQPPAHHEHLRIETDDMRCILPALTMIRDDPARQVTIAEAAKACALGKTNFWVLFRKYIGMSFTEYCLQYRLSYAAHQLMTTTDSLNEIASRAGFTDASHLHHAFTKHYGCTPGKYRVLYNDKKKN